MQAVDEETQLFGLAVSVTYYDGFSCSPNSFGANLSVYLHGSVSEQAFET